MTTDESQETADELRDVLHRNGFVRCYIAACNCGSWHARYGLPERMAQLCDMLANAGHPPTNANGNLVSGALRELIARIAQADSIITLLTADHNTGPNYVRGLEMAQTYCERYIKVDGL